MKTILITGAAGFIGSNLCHWILENTNHLVIGVDDLSGGYAENLPMSERFRFIKMNILRRHLAELYEECRPDTTFHLAAYASEGRSNHIRSFIHENNTLGTCNVINCCVNYNSKLVFTSSVAVYSGRPPFSEVDTPNPIDEYGLSKWMSERSIKIAGEHQGLDWCIVRPRNVYGVRQSLFDPSRNLMGIFCYQALTGQPLTVFGSGNNKRSFTYIDDILEPMYKAAFVSKQAINLGSPIANSISDVVAIFKGVRGYDNVSHLPPREEVSEASCYTSVSEAFLGYWHKTYLEEGIKKMWTWAMTVKMRERQVPPPLEVSKNAHVSLLS